MNRSVVCIHCGAELLVEPLSDDASRRLVAHLWVFHDDIGPLDMAARWAELLEHFRMLPSDWQPLPG